MKTKIKNWITLFGMIGFFVILIISCDSCKKNLTTEIDPTIVTDIDGNVYHTVTIGTQTWLVENLKTTKYRNGDPIPNVTVNANWIALTTGAYSWYNNNESAYNAYGILYNGYSVADNRNIAPLGWHVPTDAEWTTLTTFLGGESVAGGKLKGVGTAHWQSPNTGASNSCGFTALPGGLRNISGDGLFTGINTDGSFWSSTPGYTNMSWVRMLGSSMEGVYKVSSYNINGYSVRCVKD